MKKGIRNTNKFRLAGNFTALSLMQAVNFLLPLVTLPYLVRILGTDHFGLVVFAQSLAMFFHVLVEFGLDLSATREIAIHQGNSKKVNEIFSSVYAIKASLIVLSFLLLTMLVFQTPRLREDWEIYLLSFGSVLGQALFPLWFFQGMERMKLISWIQVSGKAIFTVLVLLLIRRPDDFLLVPVFQGAGFIAAGAAGVFIAMKAIDPVFPDARNTRKLFSESSKLFVSNLASYMYTYSNVLILGALTNNTMVGVYSSMEKLILAVKTAFTPMFQTLFPHVSRKSGSDIIRFTQKLVLPMFLLGLIIAAFLIVFAGPILDLLYADVLISRYSKVLQILGGISLLAAMSMLFNLLFLTAMKKYRTRMRIMLFSGIFHLVLAILLTKWYGIYGIAWATLSTEFLLLLAGGYEFKRIKHEETGYTSDSRS